MLIATSRAEQNRAVIDPWSAVHLGVGLAAGLLAIPLVPAVAGSIAYEVVEHQAERTGVGRQIFLTEGPETPGNVAADVALFAAGVLLGHRWLRT